MDKVTTKPGDVYVKAEDGTLYCFVCAVPMERRVHRFKGPGWRCPDCGRFVADSDIVQPEEV